MCFFRYNLYEWAKRTKFILAVMYGSVRRHQIGSKTFKKNRKNVRSRRMTIFGPAKLFGIMNRPDPAVTLFKGLFLWKYIRWGFEILTQSWCKTPIYVIKSISLIVWKLWAFSQRSNFSSFFHNFRLRRKF